MEYKRLKIVYSSDSYFPIIDGVAVVIKNYTEQLKNTNDIALVIPRIPHQNITPDGYQIIKLRAWNWLWFTGDYPYVLPWNHRFAKKLDAFKPDIIHIHTPFNAGKLLMRYAKKHHIPVVLTMHTKFDSDLLRTTKSKIITKIFLWKLKQVIKNVDRIYFPNEHTLLYNRSIFKIPNLTGKIIPNCTEMVPLQNEQSAIDEVNARFHIHPNTLVFTCCFRIVWNKNLKFYVALFKEFIKYNVDFVFIVIGDGAQADWFRDNLAFLGKHVIFTGKITDRIFLQKIFLRANLSIFPSEYDCASLTVVENACNKTPILAIKDTGTAGEIIDNVNGFLCENDPIAFAKRIKTIIDQPQLLQKVSEAAFKTIYKTWSDVCKMLIVDYNDVIEHYAPN